MAETILVIAEQREGKLNRVSFETLAGAQALGQTDRLDGGGRGRGQQHCIRSPPRSQRPRSPRSTPSKTRRWSSTLPMALWPR